MIAFLFATLNVSANEGKLNLVDNENTKSVVFELEAPAGNTDIRLFDANNNIIYSENITKDTYLKKFDLAKLESGLYFFSTEDEIMMVTYTIRVAESEVTIIDKKEKSKPIFKKEENMLYLNLLNLSKKKVQIEVYDSSNRLVFSEKRENEMIIEKAFNFTKAFEDSYTVIVTDSEKSYFENILVN